MLQVKLRDFCAVGELLCEYIHNDGDERRSVLGRGTPAEVTTISNSTSRCRCVSRHLARLCRHYASRVALFRRRRRRKRLPDPMAARLQASSRVLLGLIRVPGRLCRPDRRHERRLLAPAARLAVRRTHGHRPVGRGQLNGAVPAVVGEVGVGKNATSDEARDGDRAGRHDSVRHLLDAKPRCSLHESTQAVEVRRRGGHTDARRRHLIPYFQHHRAGAHLRLQLLQPVYLLHQQ